MTLMPTVETRDVAVDLLGDGPLLRPGEVLGEWRIEQHIGQGGMGSVYSAVHVEIGKRAALKVIRRRMLENLHGAERFLMEARIVNQIQHPNIVDIFQMGRLDDGRPYLVMELLQGESLGERIDRGRMMAPDAIEVLLQICNALEAAHTCGVIHRDLKPDNIFLSGPTVKLLDWGIAKMKDRPHDVIDMTGESMVGTPRYIAPEQARGLPVDERTDVYSLGCIAHELFLEAPPFAADNVADLIVAHLTESVSPPSEVWPDIPPVLEKLIVSMLDKQAELRPSVAEVIEALQQVRGELGGRVGPLAIGSGPVRVATEDLPAAITSSPSIDRFVDAATGRTTGRRVTGTEPTLMSDPVRGRRGVVIGATAGTLALGFALMFALVFARAFSYEEVIPTSEPATAPQPPPTTVTAVDPSPAAPDDAPRVATPSAEPPKAAARNKKSKRTMARRIDPNATIDPFAD